MAASSYRNTVFALAFLAIVALPLADALAPFLPRHAVHENRRLAEAPAAADFIERPLAAMVALRAHFRDHFGLRTSLIRGFNALNLRLFGDHGNVIAGRDGWLFLERGVRADVANPLPIVYDLCGRAGFDTQTLERWAAAFAGNHHALAARGIDYYLVMVPNKHTVYPGHLELPPGCPGRATRLDALRARLTGVEGFRWVELLGPLRDAAAGGNVYHRTDSHWNGAGALAAFGAIAAAVDLDSLEAVARDKAVIGTRAGYRGDLSIMAAGAFGDAPPPLETAVDLDIEGATATRSGEPRLGVPYNPRQAPATWKSQAGNDVHALVVHDSFFHGDMQALLAEGFGTTTFVWGSLPHVDLDAVEALGADVVIHQMVERTLLLPGLWRQ